MRLIALLIVVAIICIAVSRMHSTVAPEPIDFSAPAPVVAPAAATVAPSGSGLRGPIDRACAAVEQTRARDRGNGF